ncbi:hypothetical protein PMIN06_011874 [Paraphaeosphaeria minitans]
MCDTAIKPLAKALATPATQLFLSKAKRTHDALRARTANRKGLTRWRPDLQTFYRSRFEAATAHLAPEHALHLMTLCFAYKTRAGVLAFLDSVGEGVGPVWAELLRGVVLESGWDVLRHEGVEEEDDDDDDDNDEDATSSPGTAEGFEIPTLGIAFPKQSFLAWAMHVPVAHLTIEEVLRWPAACGLGLSREVKGEVCGRLAGGWCAGGEERGVRDFFAALCVGRSGLAWCEKPREGYGMLDVGAWVERWRGIRGGEGEGEGVLGAKRKREDSARPRVVKRVRWADEEEV